MLSFDIFFKSSGSILIKVEVDDTKTYTLVYDTSKTLMKTRKNGVTYGVGLTHMCRKITRNLWTDLNKAFGEKGRKKDKKKRTKLRITEIQSLTLEGEGFIGKVKAFIGATFFTNITKPYRSADGDQVAVNKALK